MAKMPTHLLQRSYASTALHLAKMKAFVPCDVVDELNGYKCRIVEAVFDPLNIEEVNAKFKAQGYNFDDRMQVIAVTDDGSILLWGGINSIYHLKKGEQLTGAFSSLAFADVLDLTQRFKIKNKKVELDALIEQLQEEYTKGPPSVQQS